MPDGSLVGHGTGGAHLFAAMRLTRPIGRVLAHAPPGALDSFYDMVVRSRSSLERLVPNRPGPERFP